MPPLLVGVVVMAVTDEYLYHNSFVQMYRKSQGWHYNNFLVSSQTTRFDIRLLATESGLPPEIRVPGHKPNQEQKCLALLNFDKTGPSSTSTCGRYPAVVKFGQFSGISYPGHDDTNDR